MAEQQFKVWACVPHSGATQMFQARGPERSTREEAEADAVALDAAAMRRALVRIQPIIAYIRPHGYAEALADIDSALSTTAGAEYAARMEKAEAERDRLARAVGSALRMFEMSSALHDHLDAALAPPEPKPEAAKPDLLTTPMVDLRCSRCGRMTHAEESCPVRIAQRSEPSAEGSLTRSTEP